MHTKTRNRQSVQTTSAYMKVACDLRRKKATKMKQALHAKRSKQAALQQQNARTKSSSTTGGQASLAPAAFVSTCTADTSVLEMLMMKAGARASKIRRAQLEEAEFDAMFDVLSLGGMDDETVEEKTERREEEREEAELDEAEEALWSSGCVGGALYTQLSTADVNVFPMGESTFDDLPV